MNTDSNYILSAEFEDFIGVFDTRIECQPYIDHFNYLEECGSIFSAQTSMQSKFRKDEQAFVHELALQPSVKVFQEYNQLSEDCTRQYLQEYHDFIDIENVQQVAMKIQKTLPGGGYHTFHCENIAPGNYNRLLVTMLYLNDVDDGGETEFLHQSKRVKPEEGTFLIWPAGFTHMHRGNPPLKGEKYIVTSWVEMKYV